MPSLSLFESVFKESPIGNYLLSPTPEAIIFAVNDSFLKTVSRQHEDVIGHSLFDVFPGDPNDPLDTGVDALRTSLRKVIETGEAQTLPSQRYPIRKTLPNGEEYFEERFWSAVNTPIFDDSGQLVCISHTTIDITKQVRAEAALRES